MDSEGVFFPSKMCEYFSFQKIIFAITPKTSATSYMLEESGHLFFSEGEEELLSNSLLSILKDSNYYNNAFDKNYYTKFLPKEISNGYMKLLKTLK
jgi:hypothetical protein